ncbi:MAG: nucleotidyltransferase domain-containing protein [Planctomycetota bacterium]
MSLIPSERIQEIVQRLCDSLDAEEIYLFGSRAEDRADRGSDLDLLVVVADTGTLPRQLARRGRKSLRGLGFPVDLVVCRRAEFERWSAVPGNVAHAAVMSGQRIYAAGS